MLEPDRNEINNNLDEVSKFFVTRIQYQTFLDAAYYHRYVDNYQTEWKFLGKF